MEERSLEDSWWRLLHFEDGETEPHGNGGATPIVYFGVGGRLFGFAGGSLFGAHYRTGGHSSISIANLYRTPIDGCGEAAAVLEERLIRGLLAATSIESDGDRLALTWDIGDRAVCFTPADVNKF